MFKLGFENVGKVTPSI